MSGYVKRHNAIFIHVPKTAGTSIELLPWINTRGHNPIWTFPIDLRKRAFKFGFVREPHARFMSACTAGFLINGAPPFGPKADAPPFQVMRDKITEIIEGIWSDQHGKQLNPALHWKRIGNAELPHFEGWKYRVHFFPQWIFLADERGEIGVDMVGRYEALESSWEQICNRMGAVYQPLPHHRNAQTHRPSLNYFYTEKTWDMISMLYQRDFELFRYPLLTLEESNAIT